MTKSRFFAYRKRKAGFSHFMAVLLFCVITGYSLATVLITDGNASAFFNTGDRMTFYTEHLQKYGINLAYDLTEKKFTIADETANVTLSNMAKEHQWNYIEINMSDISTNELAVDFYYFNDNGEPAGSDQCLVHNGESLFQIHASAFSKIIVSFENQKDVQFSFESLRFDTMAPSHGIEKIWIYGFLLTLLCLLAIAGISFLYGKRRYRIDLYAPVDVMQGFFCILGSRIYRKTKKLSMPYKKYFRIAILTVMFIVLSFVNVYGYFFKAVPHRFLMIFFFVCIMSVASLSIEHELKLQQWRNPLVLSWFYFWVISCISDFVVKKESNYFAFYGYFVLFAVGFLFFVWNNQKEPSAVLWEIWKVFEITFLLSIAYCLLCRPEKAGMRYNGFYNNPNPFGLYLAVAGGGILCELDEFLKGGTRRFGKHILYCTELAAAVFFLWKTQCMTAIAAFAAGVLFWAAGNFKFAVSFHKMKRWVVTLLMPVLLIIPVSAALQWGITNIADKLHTTVSYPGEAEYVSRSVTLPSFTETVYAAEEGTDSEENAITRLKNKIMDSVTLNSFLSGRLAHFSTYLRNLNLFGHTKRAIVYGGYMNYSHNGFLSYMHMYGVYILIPYLFNICYCLYTAFLYWRQKGSKGGYAFFPFVISVIFFLENMMDNVDTPFHWIVWFLSIFATGMLFRQASDLTDKNQYQ